MNKEDQDILFYAFRYALGRRTAVVSQMVGIIINRWNKISRTDKELMQEEILHSINMSIAGDECDVIEWQKILELNI